MKKQRVKEAAEKHNKLKLSFYMVSGFVLFTTCIDLSSFSSNYWFELLNNSGHFFFIGLVAAIIANSTGAGGGIVFLPAFMSLGLTPAQALATSIAIQCFGMTSGSLSWLKFRQEEKETYPEQWVFFPSILAVSFIATLAGLFTVQLNGIQPPIDIHKLFALFSLLVAAIIFYRTFFINNQNEGRVSSVALSEYIIISISCLLGGAITAWISIGVGEILAVALIIMGFRVHLAIALAVCVSSLTVLSAVPYHIMVTQDINLNILFFAAPGAIIGGAIAKAFATKIGIKPLKIFMATWIALSGLVYLV